MQAAEPPPAVELKPLPEIEPEAKAPAEAAGAAEIRKRLAEMDRAEALAHQAQQPQPPQPQQQPQQVEMPAAVQRWLAEHPQYLDPRDPIAQGEIHVATLKCLRDGLKWTDDNFLPAIERHLGLRQQPQPNGNGHERHSVEHPRPTSPAPPPRPRPTMGGAPMSAPPSREPPSMSTGRSPSHRAPLTRDELEIAAVSGQTPEQYQEMKERLARLKASGAVQ